ICLIESLNAIADEYKLPIIFSTHPRTRKNLTKLKGLQINKLIRFVKPLGFFDYVFLEKNAKCTLSDSGTITEESSILKFPAVTIRNQHERPEGMDEGTLIMCGLGKERVLSAVKTIILQFGEDANAIKTVKDYDVDNVSKKVVRIILSYTDYVNQKVWNKV
ncbi:MAG: UDP-N-acetylglucosamine 2-epimerase, partial [Candidatus Gastranaerophilales bacterium]|nr:UDP-N-acetylglucosamine 2-epimerase [Candidatus Gastranaerophilales bacterium]